MCRFIETIKIFNKKPINLDFHNQRFRQTHQIFFKQNNCTDLNDFIQMTDDIDENKTYKYRLVYDKTGIIDTSLTVYTPKIIHSLKLIYCDNITYDYKYENREYLSKLYEQRDSCDDIIIVKNKHITDTYFANIVFWDGSNWYTPDTFLLNGTKRQSLISTGIIKEKAISANDISNYQCCSLINAMLDIGDICLDIKKNQIIT